MSERPGAVLAVTAREVLGDLSSGARVSPAEEQTLVEALIGLILRGVVVRVASARGLAPASMVKASLLSSFWEEHDDLLLTPAGREAIASARLSDVSVTAAAGRLDAPPGVDYAELELEDLGRVYEELQSTSSRRGRGAHFTPRDMAEGVVRRVLEPLAMKPAELRVCDPAMGAGAFLLAVARLLAPDPSARADVARTALYGVDRDPVAVDLCRLSLWLDAGAPTDLMPALRRHLRHGDALVGKVRPEDAPPAKLSAERFDWSAEHPDVFGAARGGFDAIVGNPPWVAYAGRAAQPLPDAMRAHYLERYRAFAGYRTLHGLFVERAAELLRPLGRMGLVVPTSISDLAGYRPTRDAHDLRAEVDAELPDFGADAFEGVFQPAMALLSTRRPADVKPPGRTWSIARDDLDEHAKRMLARLSALPTLAKETFGERGLQTKGQDVKHILRLAKPEAPHVVPIREGTDVTEYRSAPPRKYLDPSAVSARLRPAQEWQAVSLYLRQTARYPVVSRADGMAFRNSVLACFAEGAHSHVLLAYLNSTPIRWLHFTRYRDARQGMPQMKIGHLRSIPAPPAPIEGELEAWGRRLGERNDGLREEERAQIDQLVMGGFALDEAERALIEAFRVSGIR